MATKYLKGGALNPAWCDEQDVELEVERVSESMELLYELLSEFDIDFNLQLGEGVDVSISKNSNDKQKEMCTIINTENDYEAKFNFLKNHSATPEDLQLAKEIIGLK